MGFNRTAVKTAAEEIRPGTKATPEPPDQRGAEPAIATNEPVEHSPRRPRVVICGSYRRNIPSLVRAFETLSAAGMRVLAPSGLDFVAEIDGVALNHDEVGIPPEGFEGLRLDCIKAADLVWLHAPDGYVGLSGALETGVANAAGVPVYAEEMPSDTALRSLVTISPLDQAIAEVSTGTMRNPGALPLPLQERRPASARPRRGEQKSAHDIERLIVEEIGELARKNPGRRRRPSGSSQA